MPEVPNPKSQLPDPTSLLALAHRYRTHGAQALHLVTPIAIAAAAVMAPTPAVLVVPNPTAAPTIEKRLRDMIRVDALPVFLQFRNDLVVIVP